MGQLIAGLLLLLSSPTVATRHLNLQGEGYTLAVIRGRALCLDGTGRPTDALFGCNETSPRFGFAASDGRAYPFSAPDTRTAMFNDSRVRQRELQVTARLRAGAQLEVIKVQSIKEGK